jgi:hypothetical protein
VYFEKALLYGSAFSVGRVAKSNRDEMTDTSRSQLAAIGQNDCLDQSVLVLLLYPLNIARPVSGNS